MPKKRATKKSPAAKQPQRTARRSAPTGKAASKPKRSTKTGGPKTGAAKAAGRSAAPRARADRSTSQLRNLEHLIEMMVDKEVVEVEIEEAGTRWRVRRAEPQAVTYAAPAPVQMHVPAVAAGSAPATGPGPLAAEAAAPESGGEVFRSPMVGTFYRASSPDAEPFCKPGDVVSGERALCIIEAMKVMNEIKPEPDQEFEIVDVLVKNGESVEFGQPLFLIR